MGITVAQKLEVTGGGLTATFTATNTGGNMLLFSGRTANLTGVTDSQGNSWFERDDDFRERCGRNANATEVVRRIA